MPLAIEQFDLSSYDLVLSSTYAVAKGVITGPDQLHVSYVHSPIRYAWDMYHTYLREAKLERGFMATLAKLILHYIRIWDLRTANGVDVYIANSNFIAKRIWKVYRRKSYIVSPSVNLDEFEVQEKKDDYYFVTARMVPYKLIPLIVKSFSQMPNRKLIVAGDGPEMVRAKAEAGPNIEFIGFVDRKTLAVKMAAAKAFVYAAKEDFGIVLTEAQACGTPVIAFGEGGALETVVDGETGLFFYQQTSLAIIDAVEKFEKFGVTKSAIEIRRHAENFSAEKFRENIHAIVDSEFKKIKLNSHCLEL
jgi:glycosyltransferase involved in cell wall biosynthesis